MLTLMMLKLKLMLKLLNGKAGVESNVKAKVEMAMKVMVNLMTMSLLMLLPKIPSLNGDQSKSDSNMCANMITKKKQFPKNVIKI